MHECAPVGVVSRRVVRARVMVTVRRVGQRSRESHRFSPKVDGMGDGPVFYTLGDADPPERKSIAFAAWVESAPSDVI